MPDVEIPGTVTAAWAGGFSVHYAQEARVLNPGDEAQVPVDEALASDNWTVVGGKRAVTAALKSRFEAESAAGLDPVEADETKSDEAADPTDETEGKS